MDRGETDPPDAAPPAFAGPAPALEAADEPLPGSAPARSPAGASPEGAPGRPGQRWPLHLGLLIATIGTTSFAGFVQFGTIASALAYSLPLMAILIAHEAGHFVAAKVHGVPASLPYFVPLPVPPGTLGAVISMRHGVVGSRRQLLDIGAAGPLAGLVVAIPVVLYGIATSRVVSLEGVDPSMIQMEGNSIFYLAAKYALKGQWLPSGGIDIEMNPTCQAGWFGLFVTALNLLPIGQLDGGHVMAAHLGGDRHERWSALAHRALPAVGLVVALYVALISYRHGSGSTSLWYGLYSGIPWVIWYALLHGLKRLSQGRYHPPVDNEPLGPGRRAFILFMGVVYLLIFMPYVWRIGPAY